MLQSITVLLLVLTIKKGSCIVEFEAGGPWFCCSFCWFLCTKFLKAICCRKKEKAITERRHQCFQELELHSSSLPTLMPPVTFYQVYLPPIPLTWNKGVCSEKCFLTPLENALQSDIYLLCYMCNYLRLRALNTETKVNRNYCILPFSWSILPFPSHSSPSSSQTQSNTFWNSPFSAGAVCDISPSLPFCHIGPCRKICGFKKHYLRDWKSVYSPTLRYYFSYLLRWKMGRQNP